MHIFDLKIVYIKERQKNKGERRKNSGREREKRERSYCLIGRSTQIFFALKVQDFSQSNI
jgi:hypothetical protein